MYFELKCFIWFIVGFSTVCETKVILNIRIFNYQNFDDIKHDGNRCEVFYWTKDHCDPMFHVCVTSRYKCDILNFLLNHWNNKKYISVVLSRTIKLEDIPSILITNVKVEDHDRYDAHDHIAMFQSTFNISGIQSNYSKKMTVTPARMNVELYTSFTLRCEDKYYGVKCEQFCEPKLFNYDCHKMTGEKICSLNCGKHGICSWNRLRKEYMCSCNSGWSGDLCQFIHYNNCSKLSCASTCIKNEIKKYCSCSYDNYIEKCSEILPLSTRRLLKSTPVIETIITKRDTTKKLRIHLKSIPSTKMSANILLPNGFLENIQTVPSQIIEQKSNEKEKEAAKQKSNSSFMASHLIITIIVTCLLLLICGCIIAFVVIKQNYEKKEIKNKAFYAYSYSNRPLPPVIYKPNEYNTTRPSSIFSNSSSLQFPKYEYDTCTLQTDYETHLINFLIIKNNENEGIYEEPINGNVKSFGDVNRINNNENHDNEVYQEPIKQ